MKNLLIIFLFVGALGCKSNKGEESLLNRAKGNSIQIDPSVLYSLNITPEQLVADLKKADIKTVHFFVVGFWEGETDDNLFRQEYIKALEDAGIGIWLMLLGNGFSYQGPPPLSESYRMGLIVSYYPDGFFGSFHSDGFVNWQVERVKRIIKNYNFMGIEFAESFFPSWKTIDGNGFYGDVSPAVREKFTKQYLNLDHETLTLSEIRNNAGYYKKWQDFRVDAIVNFNHKIKEAIKSSNPDVLFASWGMGIRNGTMEEIREHWGLDMVRIVREVEPDIYYVQTSATDWQDNHLKPQYIEGYSYIVDALRNANPKIFLGVQTDIASHSWHNPDLPKRDGNWWKAFMNCSLSIGYNTNTAYEYGFYKKQGLWVE